LDLILLPGNFALDAGEHSRIDLGKAAREEAAGLDVIGRNGLAAHAGSFAEWESFATRRSWRPPSNSVCRKVSTQLLAMSSPISLAPSAMTFALLWRRASAAETGSETSAQRAAGLRLTAIEMPIPDPQMAMPKSASPAS